MAQYRAGIIGLGWMGVLYDLAPRLRDRFQVDDVDRPTPEVDPHRRSHHWQHPGNEGLPSTYAEALWDRPEVELVAGADRDQKRLQIFAERYGVRQLYANAEEMLRRERLDIVAVATNTKGRADLTCLADPDGMASLPDLTWPCWRGRPGWFCWPDREGRLGRAGLAGEAGLAGPAC